MVTQFYVIAKKSGEKTVDMDEMRKHISFKYVQQGQDYNKGTKPTEKHVEAVFCDREIDFGKNQFTKSKYDFFDLRNF